MLFSYWSEKRDSMTVPPKAESARGAQPSQHITGPGYTMLHRFLCSHNMPWNFCFRGLFPSSPNPKDVKISDMRCQTNPPCSCKFTAHLNISGYLAKLVVLWGKGGKLVTGCWILCLWHCISQIEHGNARLHYCSWRPRQPKSRVRRTGNMTNMESVSHVRKITSFDLRRHRKMGVTN